VEIVRVLALRRGRHHRNVEIVGVEPNAAAASVREVHRHRLRARNGDGRDRERKTEAGD
jgi:hypothetical protein